MCAVLAKGHSFAVGEEVTDGKLNELVDLATISGIVNADIDAGAAIAFSKIAQANIDGSLLTGLANIVSGAGVIPVANLTSVAQKGANSDITSLTGLTTPLSIAQGGTASTTNISFYDRGDPTTQDFTQATLITDATWRDMDLSAIVPAGAKAVLLNLFIYDDAVNSLFQLRKNGNTNALNCGIIQTQVINVGINQDMVISCDTNRVIEYWGTNLTFTFIYVTVKGWWM